MMNKLNKRHTLLLLVVDKPTVLARMALIFARRNINIERITAFPAKKKGYSQVKIIYRGDSSVINLIGKQCNKLIDVVTVKVSTTSR